MDCINLIAINTLTLTALLLSSSQERKEGREEGRKGKKEGRKEEREKRKYFNQGCF